MGGRIDLNAAGIWEVAELPGVDRRLARRIIRDRRHHGPFRSLQDVGRVEGLNATLITSLADRVDIGVPEGGFPAIRLSVEQIGRPGDEPTPIVFAGTPGSLTGSFVLRNDGDPAPYVPPLWLESDTLRRPDGTPFGRLAIGVVPPPGARERVTATVRVDPLTPPGSYEAELVAGDKRYPVMIYVTEQLATGLSPSNLVLPTVAGKYERQLVVRNDGNVALNINDIGVVLLDDTQLAELVFRGTLQKTEHPTWDDLVGTVVDELKNNLSVGPLKVRTKNKPVHIEPGGNALLILEIEVPADLHRRRNFTCETRIRDATLTFELVSALQPLAAPTPALTTTPEPAPRPSPTRARRSRSREEPP
jgi:competence protein ComEA